MNDRPGSGYDRNLGTLLAVFALVLFAAGLVGLAAMVMPTVLGLVLVIFGFFFFVAFHYILWGWWFRPRPPDDDDDTDESQSGSKFSPP